MASVHLGEAISLLVGAVLTILGGALFTDSVEVLAIKFRLTTSMTGAVISPLLTSLPELFVFVVAVFIHGGVSGEDVGIGTIIGEPFMASTLIYPMLLLASVLGYLAGRRTGYELHPGRELVLPFLTVSLLFPLISLPNFVPGSLLRYVLGSLLLSIYFVYVYLSARRGVLVSDLVGDKSTLVMYKLVRSERAALALQLVFSVLMIAFGSRLLVSGVIAMSRIVGVSPQVLSILIVPCVAALPESITGIIWAYRGRDTLAIASIVGEKVLYSTFYPGLALFVTHVKLDIASLYCIAVTCIVSLLMLYYVYRGKIGLELAMIGLSGYVVYVAGVLVYHYL